MNIILKGFDDTLCKILTESMTKGLDIGTCISIGDAPELKTNFETDTEHIYMSARDARAGKYPGVDWSKIEPLDAELIEAMSHCEVVFLKMVERYAIYADISYTERKRQYLRHLRYWNHMLDEKKIDLLLMRGPPHQCYDLVLWDLCKHKGIKTLGIQFFYALDVLTVEENWEDVGIGVKVRMDELVKEYKDNDKPIELTPEFEEYYTMYAQKRITPWDMYPTFQHLTKKSLFGKWIGAALRVLKRNPWYLIRSVISYDFWVRKYHHSQTRALYDKLAEVPDLSVPYIYAPLHMQPEASTCPSAGVFVDQELIAQMLDACAPEGVRIYVKEHPTQGELLRDEEFYETLNAIPSVTLVPRNFDTFQLSEKAVINASGTGSACLEGIFKGIPALLFGHKYFQFAPGVHRVHSLEDCRNAVTSIFEKKKTHRTV